MPTTHNHMQLPKPPAPLAEGRSPHTYVSLFSSAGVGCYGFKQQGFDCVATNELLPQRIAVQMANHKCRRESGYICGDATDPQTHHRILEEIDLWKREEGMRHVDVVFATPPCQGMSTANYKKTDHEQIRNSLVVEAIRLIRDIRPKVFVFENVRAFIKSICTDITGEDMPIGESIRKNLEREYNIYWKVINFKDYGVPSSRPRTIVIGTSKSLPFVTPLLLFPTRREEILLRDSIGGFPRLAYCEKDKSDPLHFARPFPEYMLPWIKDLKEGETAFDNPDDTKPYSLDKDGNKIINKGAYMGNKYRRLFWNRPGACIATRSDIMSSQDTLHPCDNRVLSIRELMTLMTIPDTFQWTDHDEQLTVENSDDYLKENEGNIRRCIGEAVPTLIAATIARKIRLVLDGENPQTAEDDNFFAEARRLGCPTDPDGMFGQICALDSQREVVNIKIKTLQDFVDAAPQLASYYSHIESLNIDVVGLSDEDKAKAERLLTLTDLGKQTHVAFLQENHRGRLYHVVIDHGNVTPQNPTKPRAARRHHTEDHRQLSLF